MATEDDKGHGGPPSRDPNAQARHDLRTPVNQILGYSELLQEEMEDRGLTEFVSDLQKIQTAARNQIELINKILAPPASEKPTLPMKAPVTAPGDPVPTSTPPAIVTPATAPAPTPAAQDGSWQDQTAPIKIVPVVVPSLESEGAAAAPVLVVDDNEMNRDMLSRRLKGRGYDVSSAEDGYKALELIDKERFDTIILDVMMPGITGLDVLKKIRETKSMSDLPVIMATARDASEDIVHALQLGANDYVTKPLDFNVVLARLQTQLALKRQKDEIKRLADNLERRNRFIKNTFGRYLSDEVVEGLLDNPEGLKLGGEMRRVTIMMSDLRAFTAVSERLGPEQVVHMLNRYLGAMAEIILRYQGTIDEFIGDAILAIFGAPNTRPDDARRALSCALSMQLAMDVVNAENLKDGLPPLEMGIAIHTGDVVVGNIGSDRRTKYGVVGPPVNITGRIESYTVGGQVLVSQQTLDAAGEQIALGDKLEIVAKGAKAPISVFPLLGLGPTDAGLFLPDRREPLVDVNPPVRVRCWKLDGKHVGGDVVDAVFIRLSSSEAEMRTAETLDAMTNLKLRVLEDDGSELDADLYVKVTKVLGRGALLLRFTSVPPQVEARIKARLGI
jgi:class 3 adenylate cyclase/CheY-like chemotaxis protein